jgi:HNH endonuclease
MGSNERLEVWKRRVRGRAKASHFEGAIADYAVGILDRLHQEPSGIVAGRDLKEVAAQLGIPLKFVMRSLMFTMGIVRLDADRQGSIQVVLQREKLGGRKASSGLSKKRIRATPELRRLLMDADQHSCSHCARKTGLTIDHIIPLSLLGADEPGNWVALCKPCNSEKWQNLEPRFLKCYRGRKITERIGIRFRNGRLWPRINGKPRFETRRDLTQSQGK